MKRSLCLAAIAVLGCGNVKATGGDGGIDAPIDTPMESDGPPQPAPGSFVWQQNMFGSFPAVTLANDQPYVAASQFAQLDLGKGLLVPGGKTDVLAARFDPDGRIQWSWRHGGVNDEFQVGMSIDPFGNPAIAGLYRATGNAGGMDLPPAPSTFNGYIASYTETGALRWQLPITDSAEAFPRSSSTNGSGNTAVAGHFIGLLDVGGSKRQSAGSRDAFYLRVNDIGGVSTLATFGGSGDDTGNAAIFDPLGTLILVGTFSGQVAFGSIMLDAGIGRDVFVVRASIQGVPMWAVQGGSASDVGDPVAAVTSTGDVVLAVDYQGTFKLTDGDTISSAGASDIAFARVSSAGRVLWTKTLGGPGEDRQRNIAVGAGGDIALTGEFSGQAGFGGAVFTSAGFIDSFVAKFRGSGEHVWSHATGSAADDRGLGVAVDASGAVYYTGSFHNTVGFGGEMLTAPGNEFNGVLVKYRP
jgi:hypothetical protein